MTKKQPTPLSQRSEEILYSVFLYRYLSLAQITRLFFSTNSKNHSGQYAKKLTEANYLTRFPLPSTCKGNRELIYTLSYKGLRYLASLGHDTTCYCRLDQEAPSYQHIRHTLCVNDFLIAGSLLAEQEEAIELAELRCEWMLKRTPLSTIQTGDHGRTMKVIVAPDGFLDFRYRVQGKTYQTAIWVEVDLASEKMVQFRKRIRALHAVITSGACKQQFHSASILVAFATTAGEKRVKDMKLWGEQELKILGKTQDSDLFLFTSLPEGAFDPQTVFLAPTWSIPFETTLVPLLDLS